jgi:HD superfamily phosphohydrolase
MALEIVRRIRGNLHGSTDVSLLEDLVIDHPLFQRLRRIQQTAFLSLVFPGATHTRFEHSIGVMHLAGVAWGKLRANQMRLETTTKKYKNFADRERRSCDGESHGLLHPTFPLIAQIFDSDYVFQALRLAALLHDLGHPPYSHSGEKFLPSLSAVIQANPNLPDYIRRYLAVLEKSNKFNGLGSSGSGLRHEVYTIILADQLLQDVYKNNPDLVLKVSPQDVLAIIEPGIQPGENSELAKTGVLQVCHELVSGEIDIDRMDYLLRDSKECGVVYGIFDVDRILDSLCIYFEPRDNSLHLAIQYSGLAALEDYFRARQSMYLQLYFHKTSVAAEAMLQSLLGQLVEWRLPAKAESYAEIDEHNFGHVLKAAAMRQFADPDRQATTIAEIDDLLYRRRLWKRVFEVSGVSNAVSHLPSVNAARTALMDENIPFEQVSSSNMLTNFRPRESKKQSQHYLRLVKKDNQQFLRVVPVEDHSRLVGTEQVVHITRLYVRNSRVSADQNLVARAFKAINKVFDQ